jgi:hypothetical protein
MAQAGRPNSAAHDTHAGRILQGIGTFIGIERDNQKTLTYAADEKAWLLNANTPVSPLSDFHFIFLCLHSLA